MVRLPTVGGDSGNWGTILNEFLNQEHDSNGTHGTITPTDIKAQGPWVDVRNYASINAAVTAIGSDNKTLLIPDEQTVSADVTVPANVHLLFIKVGSLSISSGVTVTINGPLEAGLYQIFSGSGTVSFGAGAVKEVYPQWWGAKGDGITLDRTAINAASAAYRTFLPPGTYLVDDYLQILNDLEGSGEKSVIKASTYHFNTFEGIHSGVVVLNANYIKVSNLKVLGAWVSGSVGANTHGIYKAVDIDNVVIEKNSVYNAGYSGIMSNIGEKVTIRNNRIDTTGVDAIEIVSDDSIISENIITNAGVSSDVPGAGIELAATARNIICKSNIIRSSHMGVGISGTSQKNILIKGNEIIDSTDRAINVAPAAVATNVVIDSNIVVNSAGVGIIIGTVSEFKVTNNLISGPTLVGIQIEGVAIEGDVLNNLVAGCSTGINYSSSGGHINIIGNKVNDNTNPILSSGTMTGVIIKNNQGFNPKGSLVYVGGNPTLPNSDVVYTNLNGYDCMVTIYLGTITNILVGRSSGELSSTGLTSGTFMVPTNGCIKITYNDAPTWSWYGL